MFLQIEKENKNFSDENQEINFLLNVNNIIIIEYRNIKLSRLLAKRINLLKNNWTELIGD